MRRNRRGRRQAANHMNVQVLAENLPDPVDEQDRDGGALEDADEDAMQTWAEAYDDLNGAPENEEDR